VEATRIGPPHHPQTVGRTVGVRAGDASTPSAANSAAVLMSAASNSAASGSEVTTAPYETSCGVLSDTAPNAIAEGLGAQDRPWRDETKRKTETRVFSPARLDGASEFAGC
jgi:hypothetical protein